MGGLRTRPRVGTAADHGHGHRDRGGYRIDGIKDRVEAAAQSGLLLVVARARDGRRQFLVPPTRPASVAEQQSVDLVKRYAKVTSTG